MKIGIVQFSPAWENPDESINILNKLFEKGKYECDALIFPEMTLTGFTMRSVQFAEDIDGISTSYFIKLAKEMRTHIFAGIIEKDEDKIYNSLVHFDNKGIITARYRKIHPFSYAGEDKNYVPGNELVITKIGAYKIGLSVCYDLRFPELYRLYGKAGVDVIINIANWPAPRIDHWKTLLKARAIENQCFVIGVNRTGSDGKNEYNGSSAVFAPLGEQHAFIENSEGVFVTEIDLGQAGKVRESLPFLKDIKLI